MKPPVFDLLRPDTLGELLEALAEYGSDAALLGGGQSLMPMLNMRLTRPKVLIDTMRLTALARIDDRGDHLRIGLGLRQRALELWPGLAARQPLLAAAFPLIGHVQTRARGTVCGSIAHADPSAELPTCLIALGGEVHLQSRRKERSLPAEAFFTGMMSTQRSETEAITAVSFPTLRPGTGYAFREISRRHGDFAICALAGVVGAEAASLTVAGVDDLPRRFALPRPGDPALDEALNEVAWTLNARDDLHASARYRRELVRRLGRKVLEEAAAQCAN